MTHDETEMAVALNEYVPLNYVKISEDLEIMQIRTYEQAVSL